MKKLFLSSIILFAFQHVYSQINVQAGLSSFKRKTPLTGITGNANYNNTWTNTALTDSVKNLNPQILRYPGGTPGNYWDWNTGWPAKPFSSCYPNAPSPSLKVRHNELKIGLDSCNADMLYTLNMLNSTLSYQLKGIDYAASLSIPIKYLEFGNEHNLTCDAIADTTYASMSKVWADTIKSRYPTAKICLVGGDVPSSAPNWVSTIASKNIKYDALSFHVYPLPASSAFNVKNAFFVAYNITGQRFNISHFSNVSTKEVWVTEYNMSAANTSLANSWVQSLFILGMMDTLLQKQQVTMLLPWAYSGPNVFFQSLDYSNFKMKATGVAVKLINDVSRGLDSCRKIAFSPVQYQSYNGISYPKIFGYKFYKAGISKALFVNLSSSSYNVDISSLGSNISYNQYYADTSKLITDGFQSLTKTSGTSKTILMQPYSVAVVDIYISTSIPKVMNMENTINVYPNPSEDLLYLPEKLTNFSFKVYNANGKLLCYGHDNKCIDISGFEHGIYYIRVTDSENKSTYSKFVK